MVLRVVGAGLPRTGTMSLKQALERLLGGPCYHMIELFEHPENANVWGELLRGEGADLGFLDGYVAAVDWPASALWRELSAAHPDAVVLLSVRDSGEQWWRSVSQTILPRMRQAQAATTEGSPQQGPLAEAEPELRAAVGRMFQSLVALDGFADAIDDKASAAAWYDRYVDKVRDGVPSGRLLEWKASDGWGPLCDALGVPVPDEPFPRLNSTEEFLERGRQQAEPARSEP